MSNIALNTHRSCVIAIQKTNKARLYLNRKLYTLNIGLPTKGNALKIIIYFLFLQGRVKAMNITVKINDY